MRSKKMYACPFCSCTGRIKAGITLTRLATMLQVFAIVTGEYAKTEAMVRNQVAGFIHFLDVMMAPEDDGEAE